MPKVKEADLNPKVEIYCKHSLGEKIP